jgi:hypothetical protein
MNAIKSTKGDVNKRKLCLLENVVLLDRMASRGLDHHW